MAYIYEQFLKLYSETSGIYYLLFFFSRTTSNHVSNRNGIETPEDENEASTSKRHNARAKNQMLLKLTEELAKPLPVPTIQIPPIEMPLQPNRLDYYGSNMNGIFFTNARCDQNK